MTQIEFTLSGIMDKIHLESAYIGAKAMGTDSSAFERISTIEADTEMCDKFVTDTFPILESTLSRYDCLCERYEEDGTISFTVSLSLPTNFSGTDKGLEDTFKDYIAKRVFAEWVTLSKAGNYEYYFNKATESLQALRTYLTMRDKPIRKEPTTIKYKKTTYE